jgi:hypothetical protein
MDAACGAARAVLDSWAAREGGAWPRWEWRARQAGEKLIAGSAKAHGAFAEEDWQLYDEGTAAWLESGWQARGQSTRDPRGRHGQLGVDHELDVDNDIVKQAEAISEPVAAYHDGTLYDFVAMAEVRGSA